MENKIKVFKWISILEGLSFLLLLFIAMPLKYIFDLPQMVQQIGMAHGILFIAYVMGAFYLFKPMSWNFKELSLILACSLVPFGPFYVEKKYL